MTDEARNLFALENVSFSIGGERILQDISLSVAGGGIHALVGRHHEGKSTLCALLSGDLSPDAGAITVGGRRYRTLGGGLARKLGVAMVGGNPQVIPGLTVGENLLYRHGPWWKALGLWRNYLSGVRTWLDRIGVELPLGSLIAHLPNSDWTFIDILGRLYQEPRLLILDEPMERLKPHRMRQLLSLLRGRIAAGMAVLWVTHKIEEVLPLADTVTVVRRGRVILNDHARNVDRLNVINLCYAQLDDSDEGVDAPQRFKELLNFTGAILRDLPVGVVIMDRSHLVRVVNQSARTLLNAPEGEDAEIPLADLLGERNARISELILGACRDPGPRNWHSQSVSVAEGERLSDIRLQPIREDGGLVGHMIMIEDVSLREELRQRAALSENLESIGLLAAGVAHEVNNPLEIINNYLDYLKWRESGNPEFQGIIRKVDEETARIQQIVNNLVAFSAKASRRETTIDAMALAREICELLSYHVRERGISFACDGPDGRALVKGDPNEMRQVFLNLIRNSLDAMQDGGKIGIAGSVEPDRLSGERRVVLTIRDNGPGIRLSRPADVFLPFVTTKKEGGAHQGLGLYIVYGIIEKHGGEIGFANLPEGGCQFTINLPLASV